MNAYTITQIVLKIIGSIKPVGCGSSDPERYRRLDELTMVVTQLLNEIQDIVTENRHSHEGSVIKARNKSIEFLNSLEDYRVVESLEMALDNLKKEQFYEIASDDLKTLLERQLTTLWEKQNG